MRPIRLRNGNSLWPDAGRLDRIAPGSLDVANYSQCAAGQQPLRYSRNERSFGDLDRSTGQVKQKIVVAWGAGTVTGEEKGQ